MYFCDASLLQSCAFTLVIFDQFNAFLMKKKY